MILSEIKASPTKRQMMVRGYPTVRSFAMPPIGLRRTVVVVAMKMVETKPIVEKRYPNDPGMPVTTRICGRA